MKKFSLLLLLLLAIRVSGHAQAAEVAKAIQEGVKKVIIAIDLKIQRLQNETIWLQNAQKTMENILSKTRLDEIAGWVERQRVIYADYFEELNQVKSIIAYYYRIDDIKDKQVRIVNQYRRAYELFKRDKHFTAEEIAYMGRVYTGILEKSLQNLEQLFLVVRSFTTTMSDRDRMAIVEETSRDMDETYHDLERFNTENRLLSLSRSKDARELAVTKALYGIQ